MPKFRTKQSRPIARPPRPNIAFVDSMTNIMLRRHLTYGLLALFILNTVGGLAIVFLVGVGLMSLSEKLLLAVLADTTVQAAACFVAVTRYLFPHCRPV